MAYILQTFSISYDGIDMLNGLPIEGTYEELKEIADQQFAKFDNVEKIIVRHNERMLAGTKILEYEWVTSACRHWITILPSFSAEVAKQRMKYNDYTDSEPTKKAA